MVSELYKNQLIKQEHNPYHFGKPKNIYSSDESFNPLCGDKITIYQSTDPAEQINLWFESVSCIICSASASILTKESEGLMKDEALEFIMEVETAIKSGSILVNEFSDVLNCLDEIKNYPSRTTCATLPWSTAIKLLR